MKVILTVHTTFPALYCGIRSGIVVLFTDETIGTVIHDPDVRRKHRIGNHSDFWFSCFNAQYWKRLPSGSQVTLTQEEM